MADSVREKAAIVTGAGSGMGRALSVMLAQNGWRVGLVGRRPEPLGETAELIRAETGLDGRSLVCPADIGDAPSLRAVVERVTGEWGRLDGLVNNAGFVALVPLWDTDLETIERAFAVNAVGPAYLVTLCWPWLAKAGRGVIVHTSTMGTADPFPGFFAYAGSKAGVNVFSKSIATEGAEAGVKGFTIAPGATETGMLRSMFSEEMIPADACMTADEVARVMLGCMTGARDEDNGKTILLARADDGSLGESVLN